MSLQMNSAVRIRSNVLHKIVLRNVHILSQKGAKKLSFAKPTLEWPPSGLVFYSPRNPRIFLHLVPSLNLDLLSTYDGPLFPRIR